MKRKYETIDQAATIYKELYGTIPTVTQIEGLYHEYHKNWKQYRGFRDWLIYIEV